MQDVRRGRGNCIGHILRVHKWNLFNGTTECFIILWKPCYRASACPSRMIWGGRGGAGCEEWCHRHSLIDQVIPRLHDTRPADLVVRSGWKDHHGVFLCGCIYLFYFNKSNQQNHVGENALTMYFLDKEPIGTLLVACCAVLNVCTQLHQHQTVVHRWPFEMVSA